MRFIKLCHWDMYDGTQKHNINADLVSRVSAHSHDLDTGGGRKNHFYGITLDVAGIEYGIDLGGFESEDDSEVHSERLIHDLACARAGDTIWVKKEKFPLYCCVCGHGLGYFNADYKDDKLPQSCHKCGTPIAVNTTDVKVSFRKELECSPRQ